MTNDKYADAKIFGAAIKYTGDILRPFLAEEEELRRKIEAVKSEQDMTAWYPLDTVIALFEIAEKNYFLERLASSWAIQVVREMRKQGSVKIPTNALLMLESSFPLQHQGNVGKLGVRIIDEKSAELTDSTYGPCGYLSALCENIVGNFGARNVKLTHTSNTCRKRSGSSCTYLLEWEESELLKMMSDKNK
ncbi:MAG: hypothetical protein GY762_04905 [Proteobacteria bacterium]|nr:hypothetical protein [Pseudomonadota bacterium]